MLVVVFCSKSIIIMHDYYYSHAYRRVSIVLFVCINEWWFCFLILGSVDFIFISTNRLAIFSFNRLLMFGIGYIVRIRLNQFGNDFRSSESQFKVFWFNVENVSRNNIVFPWIVSFVNTGWNSLMQRIKNCYMIHDTCSYYALPIKSKQKHLTADKMNTL